MSIIEHSNKAHVENSTTGVFNYFVLILILLFFLPYFPGTAYRVDQFLGIAYIVFVSLLFIANGRLTFYNQEERILTLIAFLVVVYVFLRISVDFMVPLGMVNSQLYFAAGMGIWYIHRHTLIVGKYTFITTLLFLSIPISLLALFQFYFRDHALTHFILSWYGGKANDAYDLAIWGLDFDYNTIAAVQVLTGTSMTSLFSGKHSLAMFCLFVIAMGVGALRDAGASIRLKRLALFAIALAFLAGLFSTSKVFFYGFLVFLGLMLPIGKIVNRPGLIISGILLIGLGIAIVAYFSSQIRVLGGVFDTFVRGDILDIFLTRYGEEGYLTSYNEIFLQLTTWIFGAGAYAGEWRISDSQYRAVLVIGGIPYFLLFHSFAMYLLYLNWCDRYRSPYSWPFFVLGVSIVLGGSGIPLYWQARTVPLWVIANLLLAIPSSKKLSPSGYNNRLSFSN